MIKKHKKSLRQSIIELRNKLTDDEIQRKSRLICNNIEELPEYKNAKHILFFAPHKKEVDLWPLIKDSLREDRKLHKTIYFPCTTDQKGELFARKIDHLEDMAKGKYGIMEPHGKCDLVKPKIFDLLLIPAIGIDKTGNRLGYGGGYFDRFLAQTKGLKLAIVFSFQIIDKILTEPHDVKVDAVLSENGFQRF